VRWIPIKFSLKVLEKFIFPEDRRLFAWGISIVVAVALAEMVVAIDPPPLNWSTLLYVFGQEKEDGYAEEKTDAGRDCREAATG
jgi:hypothetical protein